MVVPSWRASTRSPSSTSAPIGSLATAPSKDWSTGRGRSVGICTDPTPRRFSLQYVTISSTAPPSSRPRSQIA